MSDQLVDFEHYNRWLMKMSFQRMLKHGHFSIFVVTTSSGIGIVRYRPLGDNFPLDEISPICSLPCWMTPGFVNWPIGQQLEMWSEWSSSAMNHPFENGKIPPIDGMVYWCCAHWTWYLGQTKRLKDFPHSSPTLSHTFEPMKIWHLRRVVHPPNGMMTTKKNHMCFLGASTKGDGIIWGKYMVFIVVNNMVNCG